MCEQPIQSSKLLSLLFRGVFIFLLVQKIESMPSRGHEHLYPHDTGPDITKEEYDEDGGSSYYIQEDPPFITNFSRQENKRIESEFTETRARNNPQERNPSYAIKFPGPESSKTNNFIPEPVPVPSCEGKTFCEETESSYPQAYMSNIISKTERLKGFSNVDEAGQEVVVRIDGSDGGETLCGSETKIVYPKTALNGAKEWLFVLQDEKQGYKQGVRVENCDVGTAEGACQIIEGSISGYKTSCKQKYVSRVLAAVHKNGTAVTENFSMPSSCCCQIKLVGDIGARFGIHKTKAPQTPAPKTRRRR